MLSVGGHGCSERCPAGEFGKSGFLQFLGPTLQFLIGWKFYGEPMTTTRLLSFSLIWLAVGLYAVSTLRAARQTR